MLFGPIMDLQHRVQSRSLQLTFNQLKTLTDEQLLLATRQNRFGTPQKNKFSILRSLIQSSLGCKTISQLAARRLIALRSKLNLESERKMK